MVDTDPQGSLGRWFMARRETLDTADMEFSTASAWGVGYEVGKLSKQHDFVFVDTPPKVDADLRPALREADLVRGIAAGDAEGARRAVTIACGADLDRYLARSP